MQKLDWKFLLFSVAIAAAIFLRLYSFDGWLLAKGDQVRDAMVINHAFEKGSGELPLLGPRAGGTKLRLGPVFYYFQYASAKVFGNTELPTVAYPNLIFSVGSIFVFYLLARQFFEIGVSRMLTVLYSFSFLAIEYSRFTWNPNSSPFFVMLFIFALLKIFKASEKPKLRWYLLAGISYAVASQLHFTNFLGLPIMTLIFGAINLKKIKNALYLKGILAFLAVILIFYLPVIFNDMLSGGENAAQFIKAFGTKSSDGSVLEKAGEAYYLWGKYFFRILSGYLGDLKVLHIAGIIIFTAGIFCNILLFRKENDPAKKNLLAATLSAFLAFFVLYLPLGSKIDKPRFFLPVVFIPIFYLGYFYEFIKHKTAKRKIAVLFFALFLFSNFFFSIAWLTELGKAYSEAQKPERTIVLKMKKDAAWWTWNHFEKLSDYAKANCDKKDIYLSFSKKVREFEDTAQYALEQKGFGVHISKNPPIIDNPCIFYLSRTGDATSGLISGFNIVETDKIGSMEIKKILPIKSEAVTQKEENADDDAEEESEIVSPKYYWKDVLKLF